MNSARFGLILATLLISSAATANPDGKTLHQTSCSNCHIVSDHTALYSRAERRVDSLHRLGGQVSACTQQLDVDWFPDEERAVVDYLNATYYKFRP